ncbi:MAG TPA: hypothetical protein ENH82_10790 [bacterium]|nr:hypothetical protein [bacterium]
MKISNKEKTKEKIQATPEVTIDKVPEWPLGLSLSGSEPIRVSIAEDLAVILTKDAFEQLFCWAYATPLEISCLGSVHRQGNRFFIEKFYLLKQSGSFAGTELDEDAIAEFMEQLMTEGKGDEVQRIKCWGHSHPDMDVFWSTTDDDTCRLLVNDYLISICVSNNFAIRCRIDIASTLPITFDHVPVLCQIPEDKLPMKKYAEEVKNAVSERVFSFVKRLDVQSQKQDENTLEFYCEYCGNFHAEGDCPFMDTGQCIDMFDNNDGMF